MTDEFTFRHEKLDVHRHAIAFVSRTEDILSEMTTVVAAADHLDRAAESVVAHIVSGNALRGAAARQQQFEIACGSALECAACLDICCVKRLLRTARCQEEKRELQRIVQMLVGLIRSSTKPGSVHEEHSVYRAEGDAPTSKPYFNHEALEVYQLGLKFVAWVDAIVETEEIGGPRAKRLDVLSTSIVLNIAEGNGRFRALDHRRFIDIAYQSALKASVPLDVMRVKAKGTAEHLQDGKRILVSIVKMLQGMRGCLNDE